MKVKKYITKTEEVPLNIDGVTLLSTKEYESRNAKIPCLEDVWWLRSPGTGDNCAAFVNCFGDVNDTGSYVSSSFFAVRPALEISGIKGKFKPGDRFHLFGYDWTVISNKRAICDEAIGRHYFRKESSALDANDYEASDVKKFLESWLEERKEAAQ